MPRPHPVPFASQARIALLFGITAAFGAAALYATFRSDFGGPAEQIAAVALAFVAFAFISWHAAETVCQLGATTSRRASSERAMARRRSARLEAANAELARHEASPTA
jgi:hypothetical protein